MQLPASGEGALAHLHLIYVGPLDRQHRVRKLALAFLAALDRDPRLHLLIVGEGEERAWLARRATLRERLATGGRLAAGGQLPSGPERIMGA
jgi:glycosyltransferase involved in cell wall biosynthesis